MKRIILLNLLLITSIICNAQKSFGFVFDVINKNIIIKKVFTNGPAANAGLKVGDIITSVNNTTVNVLNSAEASKIFTNTGDENIFNLTRNGKSLNKISITKIDKAIYVNKCVSGDCKKGKGVFIDIDGNEYNGSFKNGLMDGLGTMNYSNSNVYVGNWIANKREGWGKLVIANGDTYEGYFLDDKIHGDGTYTSANGDTYTGIFVKGLFDGTYKHFVKKDNKSYIETYKNGVDVTLETLEKNAEKTKNNSKYETITYTNGDKYEGYTLNGVREGKGKYTANNGSSYDGDWKEDKQNGKGKYLDSKGTVYEGDFKGEVKLAGGFRTLASLS